MKLDVFLRSQMSPMIHCYVFSTSVFSCPCLCVISSERTNKLSTLTGFFFSLFHSVFYYTCARFKDHFVHALWWWAC